MSHLCLPSSACLPPEEKALGCNYLCGNGDKWLCSKLPWPGSRLAKEDELAMAADCVEAVDTAAAAAAAAAVVVTTKQSNRFA